ncbi:MAG: DUF72 domain-containing protein [Thermosipho sp. (in: Bacteria)]|nr:DUF72 domain-containing protein [Thermosipho sp. (in: thermotogales)]
MFFIGTSGWSYNHWIKIFYPENLEKNKWLNFYSKHFNTVEVNSTFYKLPYENIVKSWYKKTPENFFFAIKGTKVITHRMKLNGVDEYLKKFIERVSLLNGKLKVILWQLPPSLKKDIPLLENFIKILPINYKHAIEFRNTTWFDDELFDILEQNNIAFCISDSSRYKSLWIKTANFVYIRFHGPKNLYASEYGEQLTNYANKIKQFNCETYIYFNNDFNGFAIKDALRLKSLLE